MSKWSSRFECISGRIGGRRGLVGGPWSRGTRCDLSKRLSCLEKKGVRVVF